MSSAPIATQSKIMFSSFQLALNQLTFAHILNGETCPPISLIDFLAFVTNRDHSAENLIFVLWFRDYQQRWESQLEAERARVPIPSTSLHHRNDPFAYLDYPSSSLDPRKEREQCPDSALPWLAVAHRTKSTVSSTLGTQDGSRQMDDEDKKPLQRSSSFFWSIFSRSSPRSSSTTAPPSSATPSTILHPPFPPPGTVILAPEDQPLREEAQKGFAVFLKKGGSKELSISDDLRDFVKTCLAKSTSPDCFMPVYDEIYSVVETQCLPRFLDAAKSNINRPKQLFWYLVGLIDFIIGLIIFLVLTLLLHNDPFHNRAYRLFSLVFIAFGVMQAYSAYRGFCSQVWRRSHRQVWPWEFDHGNDEETRVQGQYVLEQGTTSARVKVDMRAEYENMSFPSEIRPLSNFGAIGGFDESAESQGAYPTKTSPGSLLTSIHHDVIGLPSLTIDQPAEMTEIERRQYEIRRATVKRPNTADAFPIHDDDEPPVVNPGRLRAVGSEKPLTSLDKARNEEEAVRPDVTFESLLHGIPTDGCPLSQSNEPAAPNLGVPHRHFLHRDSKYSVFGPEKLVEDPRIMKVYGDIKRDILIVGAATSVVWVIFCLFVPCAGLG